MADRRSNDDTLTVATDFHYLAILPPPIAHPQFSSIYTNLTAGPSYIIIIFILITQTFVRRTMSASELNLGGSREVVPLALPPVASLKLHAIL